MAKPSPYKRQFSFTNSQQDSPDRPLPGVRVDIELDNIAAKSKELTDTVNAGFAVDVNMDAVLKVADDIEKVAFVADNMNEIRQINDDIEANLVASNQAKTAAEGAASAAEGAASVAGAAAVSAGDDRAASEIARAETLAAAPFVRDDAATFFAETELVEGARYTTKEGLAWDVVEEGEGDFDHPVTGQGLVVAAVGRRLDLMAFLPDGAGADVDCTDGITKWAAKMQSLGVGGTAFGSFGFTAPLTVNLDRRIIEADATFTTLNTSDVGMDLNLLYTRMSGRWRVVCGSGDGFSESNYSNYRQLTAIRAFNSSRCTVEALMAFGAKRRGIAILGSSGELTGNSNISSFQFLQSQWCGADYSWMDQAPTAITLTGSSGSSGQNSLLTFASIPETLAVEDVIRINNEPLLVTAINRTTGVVTCWPQLRDTSLTAARFIIGSSVSVEGADANLINIGTIDATGGSFPLYFRAIFGCTVGQIHGGTQTYSLRIGRNSSSSCHGLIVGGCYREANGREVLEISSIPNGFYRVGYGTTVAAAVEKMVPVGLENNQTWGIKTETQMLLPRETVEVGGVTINAGSPTIGKYQTRVALPGQTGNGYLLLTKYGGADIGAKRIMGTITGTRGISSEGNTGFRLEIGIHTAATANPFIDWEVTSSSLAVRLVLLTYGGAQWIALEVPSLLGSICMFSGTVQGNDRSEMIWVLSAAVSDVTDIPEARTGHKRSGARQLVKPHGTYADDAAAAAAGVAIGDLYRKASGVVAWRVA